MTLKLGVGTTALALLAGCGDDRLQPGEPPLKPHAQQDGG